MKGKSIQIGISVVFGLIAIGHAFYPNITIDNITLVLITIASIPWLAETFKSFELPGGWKVEFKEKVKEKVNKKVSMNVWFVLGETYRLNRKWNDAINRCISFSTNML